VTLSCTGMLPKEAVTLRRASLPRRPCSENFSLITASSLKMRNGSRIKVATETIFGHFSARPAHHKSITIQRSLANLTREPGLSLLSADRRSDNR
jgi:hypothetical protein